MGIGREPLATSTHRLLLPFLVITLLPSAALAWLGWQFVLQDRALQARRLQEFLEVRASAAGAVIERELAARERELPALLASHTGLGPDESAVAVRLSLDRVLSHSGAPLLFVPSRARPSTEPPESTWIEAERIEFAEKDLESAIRMYRALSMSRDLQTRAGALVRLARALKTANKGAEALQVYTLLSSITTVEVNEVPADLIASFGRLQVLGSLGHASV